MCCDPDEDDFDVCLGHWNLASAQVCPDCCISLYEVLNGVSRDHHLLGLDLLLCDGLRLVHICLHDLIGGSDVSMCCNPEDEDWGADIARCPVHPVVARSRL